MAKKRTFTPRQMLLFGICCTVVFLAVTLWNAVVIYKRFVTIQLHEFELQRHIGQVLNADELRANYAQMEVMTGYLQWKNRYMEIAPKVTHSLDEVVRIMEEIGDASAALETQAAHNQLLEQETKVFENLSQGNRVEASRLLFTEDNTKLREKYREGMEQTFANIDSIMAGNLTSYRSYLYLSGIAAALFCAVLVACWFEISRLVQKHLELQQKNQALLRQLKEVAEAASEAKTNFLASLNLEFRTSLNAISGLSSMLLDSGLAEKQLRDVVTLKSASDDLLFALGEVNNFVNIEAGEFEFQIKIFNIRDLINETDAVYFKAFAERGSQLRVRISDNIPEWFCGDPQRLKSVLMNLIAYTVKEAPNADGVSVSIFRSNDNDEQVTLDFMVTSLNLERSVEEERAQNRFVLADSLAVLQFSRRGLGPLMTTRIIELMGGALRLGFDKNHAPVFAFTSNLVSVDESIVDDLVNGKVNPGALPAIIGDGQIHIPLTILLAEDDAVSQHVVTRMLKDWGHRVLIVENGQEAFEKSADPKFDLILMDIQMPVMNGIDATKAIRERENGGKRTPIVAITAMTLKGDRERCLEAGMDAYLTKPFDLEAFQRVVSSYGRMGRKAADVKKPS